MFNSDVQTLDTVSYNFKVVKDGFPIVDVSEVVDSTALKTRYFQGQIKDVIMVFISYSLS